MVDLFIAAALIQIGFLIVFWLVLLMLRQQSANDSPSKSVPISVIVAARNEAEQLANNLPSLLSQNHPEFEVLVVLDRCTDSSLEVVKSLSASHANLRYIEITEPDTTPNKKRAIATGIKAATYEHLVFTDADCQPADADWLSRFAQQFAAGKDLVLGAGVFTAKASMVNELYRLDALIIAVKYFVAAKLGMGYMGVGRSMGYTKTLFNAVGGFAAHEHIASGDDDLFVRSAGKKANISIVPKAVTISDRAPSTWKSWLQQKKRHLSTGKRYAPITLLWLGAFELTDALCTIGLLSFLSSGHSGSWSVFFVLFIIKLALLWLVVNQISRVMNYNSNSYTLIFYQPLLALLNPLFSVASAASKSDKWTVTK